MPRNGAGIFSLVNNTWFPAVNGVLATATDWGTFITDVQSALTQSVSSDGQTPMTGNLPMGNNKLTGLALGLAQTDSVSFQQVAGVFASVASAATINLDGVGSNNIAVTGTTTITAITLAEGKQRLLRFAGALILTNGASLVLPGAANITTAAGDYAIFVGRPAGVVECVEYQVAAFPPKPASSLASSGFQKLPNGMIIQWGNGVLASPGAIGVVFPITFPNACFVVIPVMNPAASTSLVYSAVVNSFTTSGATLMRTFSNGSTVGAAAESVYWIAVGN